MIDEHQEIIFNAPNGCDYMIQILSESGRWDFVYPFFPVDYAEASQRLGEWSENYEVRMVKISRYSVDHLEKPVIHSVVRWIPKPNAY